MKRLAPTSEKVTKKPRDDDFLSILVSKIAYKDVEHYFVTKEFLKRELSNVDDIVNFILNPSHYPLYTRFDISICEWLKPSHCTFIYYNLYTPLISLIPLLFRVLNNYYDALYVQLFHVHEVKFQGKVSITIMKNDSYDYYEGNEFICSFPTILELMNDYHVCVTLEKSLEHMVRNNENVVLQYMIDA